jgi:hypothetical protein
MNDEIGRKFFEGGNKRLQNNSADYRDRSREIEI